MPSSDDEPLDPCIPLDLSRSDSELRIPLDWSRLDPELPLLEAPMPELPFELLRLELPLLEAPSPELLLLEPLRSELPLLDAFIPEPPRPVPPSLLLPMFERPAPLTFELPAFELPAFELPMSELPWRVPRSLLLPLALIPPWLPTFPERLLPIDELPSDEPLFDELALRALESLEPDALRVAELPIPSSFRFTRSVRPLRLSLPLATCPLDEPLRPTSRSLCDESDDPDDPREALRSEEFASMFWSLLRSAI